MRRHWPPTGGLHHADRGSPYTATADQLRLVQHGMVARMSRKGNGYDIACMELWHSLLTKELINLRHSRRGPVPN
ncbi:MAG: hypothetical protein OWU84_04440 [Firmicutes bacterium]|nr:hypothetical protein [Bacillota bacterium]